MNITAFLDYLHKTRGWELDPAYYGQIETWRQWWQGEVPGVHTRTAEYAGGAKNAGWHPCGCQNGSVRTGQTYC